MAKFILAAIAISLLSGCATMSDGEKKAAWIAGGIIVTSIAISNRSSEPYQEQDFCSAAIEIGKIVSGCNVIME